MTDTERKDILNKLKDLYTVAELARYETQVLTKESFYFATLMIKIKDLAEGVEYGYN